MGIFTRKVLDWGLIPEMWRPYSRTGIRVLVQSVPSFGFFMQFLDFGAGQRDGGIPDELKHISGVSAILGRKFGYALGSI